MTALLKQILLSSSHPRLRFWGALLAYALILLLGSIPGARADVAQVASGLVLHSCAYAALSFLLFSGCNGSLALRACKAVLGIALMGALDEYVQSFFPYRHGSVGDWLVDCNAAILTVAAMWLLWHRQRVPASA